MAGNGFCGGAEDAALGEVKVFAPLGEDDPVVMPGFGDDRLVDDPHGLPGFRPDPACRTTFRERLQDDIRPFLETLLDDRIKFLIGRQADGTGDIGDYRSLHQPHVDDMQTGERCRQALGDIDPVVDGGVSVFRTVGWHQNRLNHGDSFPVY